MAAVTISLDNQVEHSLRDLAMRNGVTIDEYLQALVQREMASSNEPNGTETRPTNGREVLAILRREGALYRAGMTEDSIDYADRLRERSQRRRVG